MLIHNKYRNYIFSFVMVLLMSAIMSFVISVYNMGFVSNIFNIWLSAFIVSFIIALPTILIISPLVEMLVNLMLKDKVNSAIMRHYKVAGGNDEFDQPA